MINNKKAINYGISLYKFFFVFMFITGILLFVLTALPAILFQYGLEQGVSANQQLVDMGVSSEASQVAINEISLGYANIYKIADYMFLAFVLGVFIQSLMTATQARRQGILSLFGFLTLGNMLLIFMLSFSIQIRDWFLNEIIYNVLTIGIETRFIDFFFANSYFIAAGWFTLLLFVNFIDFKTLLGKLDFVSGDEPSTNPRDNFDIAEDNFEMQETER